MKVVDPFFWFLIIEYTRFTMSIVTSFSLNMYIKAIFVYMLEQLCAFFRIFYIRVNIVHQYHEVVSLTATSNKQQAIQ